MIDINEFIQRSREERRLHLSLSEPCCERGGNSTNHKGVLAQFLDTTIPSGRILLCHACNNDKCSNPKHLYWGTDYDNIIVDGQEFGTHKNPWERRVEKYGYEKGQCPGAEAIADESLALPVGPHLDESAMAAIVQGMHEALKKIL